MSRVQLGCVLSAVILAFPLASCSTPDAVSRFCDSASITLTSSSLVFDDMKASCLREIDSRIEFGAFKPPVQSDPNCTAIGDQAAGAVAAARILSDYFRAINSLASFGTAKTGTDAQTLLSQTGAAVGASSEAQTALGSIAKFLVSAATSGYQRRQLEKDLPAVSQNVSSVVSALVTIIKNDYIDRQLASEEQKLADRYREFAKGQSSEVKLLLDNRWYSDEQALAAKRASAQSLITALQALSRGFSDLATNAKKLTGKDLPDLLGPYVTQLQTLIPRIQKGF